MQPQIEAFLDKLAEENNIGILLAVEAGSRSRGFESPNSDWDVRIIYDHSLDWYLSIQNRPEVLDLFTRDGIDLMGWDIKKALRLLKKSNPTLLEWLQSPLIYRSNLEAIRELREIAHAHFNPVASTYHHLSIAQKVMRSFSNEIKVNIKGYLNALYSILGCYWIEQYETVPPSRFSKLLESTISDTKLHSEIEELLEIKKRVVEKTMISRYRNIDDFIELSIGDFSQKVHQMPKAASPDYKILNQLFRKIVN